MALPHALARRLRLMAVLHLRSHCSGSRCRRRCRCPFPRARRRLKAEANQHEGSNTYIDRARFGQVLLSRRVLREDRLGVGAVQSFLSSLPRRANWADFAWDARRPVDSPLLACLSLVAPWPRGALARSPAAL